MRKRLVPQFDSNESHHGLVDDIDGHHLAITRLNRYMVELLNSSFTVK